MELISRYLVLFEENKVHEEDFGACQEHLHNPHAANQLRLRAREGSVRVCVNGVMQVPGKDFTELHDSAGSYIYFMRESQDSLRGKNIEANYMGYALEGDDTPWN